MSAKPDWKRIADRLAIQLASHAFCDEHPASRPAPDCPFCADRATYAAYLAAGGKDSRIGSEFAGVPSVPIHQLKPNEHMRFPGDSTANLPNRPTEDG